MATCKNCVHYELCRYNTYQQAKYFGRDKEIYITIDNNFACKFYRPSTDIQEVKYGEWITTDAYPHRVYCSLCFKNYVTNEEVILERAKEPRPIFCTEAEYCPHCGAKMKRKDET